MKTWLRICGWLSNVCAVGACLNLVLTVVAMQIEGFAPAAKQFILSGMVFCVGAIAFDALATPPEEL